MKNKVNFEERENALGYKVNFEERENALGYKVNFKRKKSALGKIVVTTICFCVFVFLSGCEQDVSNSNKTQQEQKKAVGYIEKLAEIHQEAPKDIAAAVNKENKKLEEASKIIEEETPNKLQQSKNMNNIPEQINMDFAQTCKNAIIKTNTGDITITFDNDKAPVAVANFCTLAKKGFYDNLTFHRVIKDFMIQGGDPTGTGAGGPGYKFEDELPVNGEYKLGSLAMANSGPDTNGSQFFIITGDAGVGLPPLYTLFGEVTQGLDIANAIQEVEIGANDKPVEDVIIESIDLGQE